MKINGFEVEHDLTLDADNVIRGWFETPALPHVTYRIELHLDDMGYPDIDEIELTDAPEPEPTAQETVVLPNGTIAPVLPEPPLQDAPAAPADDPQASPPDPVA